MLKKVAKEDNVWANYFASIKGVCPWSLSAFMNNNILFIEYNEVCLKTWSSLFNNTKYEAFVYKCIDKPVEWLVNKCEELNEKDSSNEWLWSHPIEGGNSTPIPVLIQQDREQLECLRDKIGYEDGT